MLFVEGSISLVHPPWHSQWDLRRLPGNSKGSRPPTRGNNWPRRWVEMVGIWWNTCICLSCKTCVILCGLCSDPLRAFTCFWRKCVPFQTTRRSRSMTWQLGLRSKYLPSWDIDFSRWKLSAYSGLGVAGLWEFLVGFLAFFVFFWKENEGDPLATFCSILPPISSRKLWRCKHGPTMTIL